MPGLEIAYSSLDPDIAKPFAPFQLGRRGGFMTTLRPGKVHVVAQTMAYGVTMADTFTVTVTLPLGFDIALGRDGVPISSTNVQIQRGGAIAWLNYTLQPIDVMFDDPTNVVAPPPEVCAVITDAFGYTPAPYCGSGDITSFAGADGDIFLPDGSISMRMRQFPVPGVYRYHTSTGLAGQVVVE